MKSISLNFYYSLALFFYSLHVTLTIKMRAIGKTLKLIR